MEIDERFLTLLTPEGEFLKARKQAQDYLIGEEIHFFPINEAEKKKFFFSNFSFAKALPAAAIALMVAGATFIPFYNDNDVYAYMSIDVNPSIELAVNDQLEVVDLEAYNPEGEQIVANIKDWKHTEVSVVTTEIIEEIKNQGFFKENDQVVISTVLDEDGEEKVEEKLEANLKQLEEKIEKENVELTVVQGTKQERKAAVKQGVTTGTYKEKTKKAQIEPEEKEVEKKKKQDQPPKTSENKDNKEEKAKNEKQTKNGKGNQQAPGQQKKSEKENTKDGKEKSEEEEIDSKKNLPNLKDNNKGKAKGNENKEKKQENKKENKQNKQKKDAKEKNNN